MFTQLLEAKKCGAPKQAFTRLAKPDLLTLAPALRSGARAGVIDEVGYIPFAQKAANLFFQVISRRYETASLTLTSNRAFGAGGQVFGSDVVVAAAMIDRLVQHAEIVSLKGSSFRLKGKPEFTREVADSALPVEPVASA